MEKLIFVYYESDGCSYSATHTIPFEYESKAKTENDFFELAYEQFKNYLTHTGTWYRGIEFFKGYSSGYGVSDFFTRDPKKEKIMKNSNINAWEYMEPQILTLQEWFDANREEIYQKVVDSEK